MYGLCIGLSMVEYLHAAHYVNQYIQSLRFLSVEHVKAPFCTNLIYLLVSSSHLGSRFLCLAHESRCFALGDLLG